jgi:hypothetical protein
MKKRLNYSLISLLVVNLLIIILAIAQSWDFSLLIWVYFFQSVIIGVSTFVKILILKNFKSGIMTVNGKPKKTSRLEEALFFLFHYGGFHTVYLVFLISRIGFPIEKTQIILITSLAFLINHTFSYFYNKKKDESKIKSFGEIVGEAYKRIFPMHMIILIGSGTGKISLAPLFLTLKMAFDLLMHKSEHSKNKKLITKATMVSKNKSKHAHHKINNFNFFMSY